MTKIELHILQNFAPSNLNRDDTGAPKDCEFGGYRRARISSQCFKRAIRDAFTLGPEVLPDSLGARTKRIVQRVAEDLAKRGRGIEEALAAAATAVGGAGFGVKGPDEDYKTEYLLFLPRRSIAALAEFLHENWDSISKVVEGAKERAAKDEKAKSKGRGKTQAKGEFPRELGSQVLEILKDGSKTPDLALFGRMIADNPSWNIDAACQVAQSISTNRMSMDFDFFTAVDDLRGNDTSGSDMMGTVQFSSACFYRYLVVDYAAFEKNLGDSEMTEPCVRGFLRAAIEAIPTGKQNSMAAHNPPSYVLTVVRNGSAPVSLANAFLKPARPSEGKDLVDASVAALESYLEVLTRMSNPHDKTVRITVADRDLPESDALQRAKNVQELIDKTVAAAKGAERA